MSREGGPFKIKTVVVYLFRIEQWQSSAQIVNMCTSKYFSHRCFICDLRWTCMARRRLRCRSPRWTGSPHARWRPARTKKKSESASGRKVRGSGRDHPDPVGRGQVNHHHRTCSGPQPSLASRSLTFLSCFNMFFRQLGHSWRKMYLLVYVSQVR